MVLRGNRLPATRLALLAVRDPERARVLLRQLADEVTTAERWAAPPDSTLSVALTHAGLAALGVPTASLAGFAHPFQQGMAARAREIGDVEADAPQRWESPGGAAAVPVHVLLWVEAAVETVDARTDALLQRAEEHGLTLVGRPQSAQVLDRDGQRREHFGYVDGLSQPWIAGADPPRTAVGQARRRRSTPLQPGEFLLGYPDEEGALPPAPEPGVLARGGSYLVYRKLAQDVPAFRSFLLAAAQALGTTPEEVAARLVGRGLDGRPTAVGSTARHRSPAEDPRAGDDFGFRDDPDGFGCPLGAHVRRVNPRDSLRPRSRVDRHRMIRRGIPYGPPLPDGEGGEQPGQDRGLVFLCFVADPARQFEFVQRRWLDDGGPFGLGPDTDVFVGHKPAGATMTLQGRPPRLLELPRQLVTVRWGEYFFLPSTTALRWISACEP